MSRNVYYVFRRHLKKYAHTLVHCPSCGKEGTIEQLPHHVETVHGVQLKTMCPYCVGQYRWKGGRKYSQDNSSHFIECMQECIRNMKVCIEPTPIPPVTSTDSVLDVCGTCTTRYKPNAYVRKRDRMNEYVDLYESLLDKPAQCKVETNLFDETKGMNNDIIGIKNRYLKNDLDWHHVYVKNDMYPTFKKEMMLIQEEIFILKYWCLCDGLTKEGIVHRHMILACEKESSFMDVWKNKVRYGNRKGERGKSSVKIKDWFHLINVIQYVSQPNSSCHRDEEICSVLDEENAHRGHFNINGPLSTHALAFGCLLIPGCMERLCRQQNMRKNVVDWFGHAKKIDRKWGVPLKVTGFRFLNCVIPLRRDLEPTDEETDMFLFWMNDRIMYLKENSDLNALSDAEWLRHQIRKGNTFRSISDDLYVLVKSQQNVMNQLKTHDKRVMEQCDKNCSKVRSTNLDLKRKLSELEREKDAEINDLRNQLVRKEDENTQLNAKILSKDAELLAKNAELLVKNAEIYALKIERRIRY